MKDALALIGYGRFGSLTAHHLKEYFHVLVFDSRKSIRLERGLRRCTFREAARCSTIILAVPISSLQSVLRKLSPQIRPKTLIIDVCSVKVAPIRWMKELLPPTAHILGTHPLFGPDSASTTLHGRSIVLCPTRIPHQMFSGISTGLRKAGLSVSIMTPNRHDLAMARSLFLTQFLGRGLGTRFIRSEIPATENYNMLRRIILTSMLDSRQLLNDMYRFNSHSRTIPRQIQQSIRRQSRNLRSSARRSR